MINIKILIRKNKKKEIERIADPLDKIYRKITRIPKFDVVKVMVSVACLNEDENKN